MQDSPQKSTQQLSWPGKLSSIALHRNNNRVRSIWNVVKEVWKQFIGKLWRKLWSSSEVVKKCNFYRTPDVHTETSFDTRFSFILFHHVRSHCVRKKSFQLKTRRKLWYVHEWLYIMHYCAKKIKWITMKSIKV